MYLHHTVTDLPQGLVKPRFKNMNHPFGGMNGFLLFHGFQLVRFVLRDATEQKNTTCSGQVRDIQLQATRFFPPKKRNSRKYLQPQIH